MADALRLQEEVLHEPFDRAFAGAFGKLHPRGDFALDIEGQPVFGPPGNAVKVAADRPEKVLSLAEGTVFSGAQQTGIDQLRRAADVVDIFADPVERVQIAQAALALFDIRLDDIAAVPETLVALVSLGQLFSDVLPLGPGHHFGPEPALRLGKQGLIAPDIAPFEQRGADCQIGLGHPDHFIKAAARLADLEPQVPQEIEHGLDHLLAPRGLFTRCDEGDIDVRMRRHFAPAIAAHRHDRQPFARRTIARRIDRQRDVIVDQADQLIDQKGLSLGAHVPSRWLFQQPPGNLRAARRQRAAQQFNHLGPGFGGALRLDQRGNRFSQRAAIDHRALIGNPAGGHAVVFCSASHSGR